jgi:receptor protein-tyrosine kinase
MSLIERAADILGSEPGADRKSPGAEAVLPVIDPIERAVRTENPKSAELRPDNHILQGSVVSRTLKIDLNKLRRQNIVTPDDQRTAVSENFRRIKRHILSNVGNPNAGHATNLVMITSALPGEGKTFCAINLAISLAMEMDRTVLLVDADVARPSVISTLGVKTDVDKGLMDVLLDPAIELGSVLYRTDIEKLTIMPAGSRHARATEMLASERMGELLEEMANRYQDRIIVFDSPPLLAASEASALAGRIGQILVVVEADKTTEIALRDALSRIESDNVVGVLLNKGRAPGPGYYGGYGYGYGPGA